MTTTRHDAGVIETPAAQPPVGTPRLTAPILFGFVGAWWASSKAKKLGVTSTKRYWIAAAISSVAVTLATVLVPILMLLAVSASVGSGTVLNNPSAVAPLGNAADAPATNKPDSGNVAPADVLYGFRPAKDDLAGPKGAVVWAVKARAACFVMTANREACLSQLYSSHGVSYLGDLTRVSEGPYGPSPIYMSASDIIITERFANNFTATFTEVYAHSTKITSPVIASFNWSPSLEAWLLDDYKYLG